RPRGNALQGGMRPARIFPGLGRDRLLTGAGTRRVRDHQLTELAGLAPRAQDLIGQDEGQAEIPPVLSQRFTLRRRQAAERGADTAWRLEERGHLERGDLQPRR